jgi:hypothetical protein
VENKLQYRKIVDISCRVWRMNFTNCVMTLYLLKVHLRTFLSTAITKKCHILSRDTLVANEQYVVQKYRESAAVFLWEGLQYLLNY